MAKEEIIKDERGACPCKACKRKRGIFYPEVNKIMGLYYAKCSNPECDKYDPYEFIGTTTKNAIENWNEIMCHSTENMCKDKPDEL